MKVNVLVEEFAQAFAGCVIYSIGDLYSGYDQFQLAVESRDIITMRTPIGLVRMCTLPQGATNSVAHMMNVMNKVLRDCIPEITMSFLDDIPMKGCAVEEKDETMDDRGCRKFVVDHIRDCEKVLRKLEDVHLTLSGEKSAFGQEEILVVGHLCGPYGRRPSPTKIDAIQAMKENMRVTIQSPKVSWGMCNISHMDSALCTHCGSTLSPIAEGEEVRMETGTPQSHEEA